MKKIEEQQIKDLEAICQRFEAHEKAGTSMPIREYYPLRRSYTGMIVRLKQGEYDIPQRYIQRYEILKTARLDEMI